MIRLILLPGIMAVLHLSVLGQNTVIDSVWKPILPFIGQWTGMGKIDSLSGKYTRTYTHILNGQFIEVRNKSVYPPSRNKPQGEIHEDIGYISYDRDQKTFILRQFHVEGFVNHYRLDSISQDGTTLTFTSVHIENIPAGFRAREIYQWVDDRTIMERFEISPPGGVFRLYSEATLQRQ